MKWPVFLVILGYLLWTYSRIGYISHSGIRVFLMSIAKTASSIMGAVLMGAGIFLLILM